MLEDIRPLIKGVFVIPDGVPVPFLYNPEEISESREVQYAKKQPLGDSHPIYHYEYGTGRDFSFEMTVRNKTEVGGIKFSFPLELYIEMLYDLTYPIKKMGQMVSAPPVILFVFSTFIRKCKIKNIEVTRNEWDRFLMIKYATVKLDLFEVASECFQRKNSVLNLTGNSPVSSLMKKLVKGF